MQLIKNENHAHAIRIFRTMRILITPFHVAPSCLALNSYLQNTDSDHSMTLGSKVWEQRKRRKTYLAVIVDFVTLLLKKWLLAFYCLK